MSLVRPTESSVWVGAESALRQSARTAWMSERLPDRIVDIAASLEVRNVVHSVSRTVRSAFGAYALYSGDERDRRSSAPPFASCCSRRPGLP